MKAALATLALLLFFLANPGFAQRDSEFMKSFRQAMSIKASDDMARLVKENDTAAVLAIIETCEQISNRSSDQLETEIDFLGKAWKKAFSGGTFVEKMYSYFSLDLQGSFKKNRIELIQRYRIQYGEYDKAEKAKDKRKLPAIGLEFQGLAEAFGELGDHYMSSQAWSLSAHCFEERLNGKDADLRRACNAWGKMVEAREKIDLKDSLYEVNKARFESLEFDGYGDPNKGPEARAREKAASNGDYRPTPLEASFELVKDIAAIRRPTYFGDENYQMWTTIFLGEKGSNGHFASFGEDRSPKVLRTSSAQAMIDLDNDGEGDVEIPLGGNISPVEFTFEENGEQRRWGFLATVGLQQDTYQGFRFNLAPSDEQMQIYIAPAASLVGMVGETPIRVIDENMDGRYGSAPLEWQYIGLRNGSFQRDIDSIVIGKEKVARPWSEFQKIGDQWYRFSKGEEGEEEAGEQIFVSKADLTTGKLKLSYKGLKPDFLILRGNGKLENFFIDLAIDGRRGAEVPAGSYSLYAGQVSKGKRDQKMKAFVLPGDGMRSYRVGEGETTTVTLGSPFGFDFDFSQDDQSVEIEGPSIVVTGAGGETYQRLWNCVVRPEVLLRTAGSKKGKDEGKMIPVGSQEEIMDHNNDYRVAWFPITAKFDKKKAGEEVEVQLFEKKNKLFGKIESDWLED